MYGLNEVNRRVETQVQCSPLTPTELENIKMIRMILFPNQYPDSLIYRACIQDPFAELIKLASTLSTRRKDNALRGIVKYFPGITLEQIDYILPMIPTKSIRKTVKLMFHERQFSAFLDKKEYSQAKTTLEMMVECVAKRPKQGCWNDKDYFDHPMMQEMLNEIIDNYIEANKLFKAQTAIQLLKNEDMRTLQMRKFTPVNIEDTKYDNESALIDLIDLYKLTASPSQVVRLQLKLCEVYLKSGQNDKFSKVIREEIDRAYLTNDTKITLLYFLLIKQ